MQDYQQQYQRLTEQNLLRSLQETDAADAAYCQFNGRTLLNFSSNDYLGLNTDNAFKQPFVDNLSPASFFGSSSSSRLLTGNSPLYSALEAQISTWYDGKNALFFNSGYHANVGVLPALTDKKDLILSDKLCHASLLDGIRLSAAKHLRFRHNDMAHLANMLDKHRQQYQRVFIVTESLFSMDGDRADLKTLVAFKQQYNALLYVDEAHAVGAYGKQGRGLGEALGVLEDIDILVCPMGKAMASLGAFVVCSPTLRELLLNRARTFIFTTALPPVNIAWSLFVIKQMPQLQPRREILQKHVQTANQRLKHYGLPTSNSYILPIIVGENHLAIELAEQLKQQGILVFPIRPPTVPVGSARLRLSLTANMTTENINQTIDLVGQFLAGKA